MKQRSSRSQKNSMSEGTVLPQLPGPRVMWTDQKGWIPDPDSWLGYQHFLLAFPGGILEHQRGEPFSPVMISKTPHFLGILHFPTSTRLRGPEGPVAPRYPPPPGHLYTTHSQDPSPPAEVPWGKSPGTILATLSLRAPAEWALDTLVTSGPSPSGAPFPHK